MLRMREWIIRVGCERERTHVAEEVRVMNEEMMSKMLVAIAPNNVIVSAATLTGCDSVAARQRFTAELRRARRVVHVDECQWPTAGPATI